MCPKETLKKILEEEAKNNAEIQMESRMGSEFDKNGN